MILIYTVENHQTMFSHHNIVDVHLIEYNTTMLFTEDNHKHLSEEETLCQARI